MSFDPTSANEEASGPIDRSGIVSPRDQLEQTTPVITDAETPPSELPLDSVSNVASSDIQIETNETIDALRFLPAASPSAAVLPDEVGSSSPQDFKPAARPSPPTKLRSSPGDNFLSAILGGGATPTNASTSFLRNFGSAASNRNEFDYFSGFDFESLNGMFSSPPAAAAGQIAFPAQLQQQSIPRPQPPLDSFPLPSYLQAQLDETYTASTLVFPPRDGNNANGSDANVFYQVTAYRHVGGDLVQSAVNYVPTAAAFPEEDKENSPNRTRVPPLPKIKTSRSRPLPLRKRPIEEHESRPATGKKMMIRHNMREEGEAVVCRCKASKCLKLYCDCFRNGKVCGQECGCTACKNTVANSGPNGIRTKTITEILKRRPDAFDKREKTSEGCKCKKNKCLKKYCVCYNVGAHCDSNTCECLDCRNFPGAADSDDEEEMDITFVEVPAKAAAAAAAADQESLSDSSSEESVLLDKRVRHSLRRKTSKPQDAFSPGFTYHLGQPSPPKPTEIREV